MIERIGCGGKRVSLIVVVSIAFTAALCAPMGWAQTPATASPEQAASTAAPAKEVHARGDIAGNWQGTLNTPQRSLRIILQIARTDKGWSAKMYSIDQGAQPFNASSVSLDGSAFKFSIDMVSGSYQGTLGSTGDVITGTWTQGSGPKQLDLVRSTRETAWEIPAPPPPPKLMAADADPSFDVATIKPNNSGASQMQGLTIRGRDFATRNSSLVDLISFAYNVQAKQIVGGPAWMDSDRYDIAAVPVQEGVPNPQQLRTMLKKLLADRFKLTFHQEKRELSAYVLTVGKNGQKLTPTQLKGPLPGLGYHPAPGGIMMMMMNGTLEDFTSFLQTLVLDRPVVDHTGIKGKFDLHFTFTPDDSEFNGHPPPLPKQADTANTSPGLFEAIQQQLVLKLDAEKTPVDVIAIDHVEKPSPN
ncbi:MAG TPA: TIGR03435 family protein [Edaphobacter sp.]|uniref:TIGR03435 family protein n=1 Tax=Edaphobacter sp. TaxID=1934404 RepID=UPI002C4405EF|nr:TIGR03435 family protein [Edaphobacter sp.]HUZ93564.1 TIGR03435 family protein [Edaphobacter sp.]